MNDVLVDAERFDSTNGGWGALEEECGGGPSNWPLFLVCILPIFFGAREYEVYEDGTFGGTNLDDCFLRDPNQSVGWALHRNPYYTRIHRHHTVLTLEFDACTWSPVSKWRRRIRPPTMRDRQIVGRTTTPDGKREWPLPRLGRRWKADTSETEEDISVIRTGPTVIAVIASRQTSTKFKLPNFVLTTTPENPRSMSRRRISSILSFIQTNQKIN